MTKEKIYKIFLKEKHIGTFKLEKGDAPMGDVLGKLDFIAENYGYKEIKEYCDINKIELIVDSPKEKMISTITLGKMKIVNENEIKIKAIGNQITGMNNDEYEISIFGIPYPFYETELYNLVKEYENRFKND